MRNILFAFMTVVLFGVLCVGCDSTPTDPPPVPVDLICGEISDITINPVIDPQIIRIVATFEYEYEGVVFVVEDFAITLEKQ